MGWGEISTRLCLRLNCVSLLHLMSVLQTSRFIMRGKDRPGGVSTNRRYYNKLPAIFSLGFPARRVPTGRAGSLGHSLAVYLEGTLVHEGFARSYWMFTKAGHPEFSPQGYKGNFHSREDDPYLLCHLPPSGVSDTKQVCGGQLETRIQALFSLSNLHFYPKRFMTLSV